MEEKSGRDGNPTRTTLTLPLTSSATSYVTSDEASDEAGDEVEKLLAFCEKPRSKNEIQKYMGIKSERYIRQQFIIPLLEDGRLLRTVPDKPSSPKQKYVRA